MKCFIFDVVDLVTLALWFEFKNKLANIVVTTWLLFSIYVVVNLLHLMHTVDVVIHVDLTAVEIRLNMVIIERTYFIF